MSVEMKNLKKLLSEQKNLSLEKDAEIGRLKALVTKDELTGGLNRRGFLEELERIYSDIRYAHGNEQARRHSFIDVATLLYIDIDNFKKANDIYGHKMGDKVLRKLVSILENETRRIDFVGRLGGDEFAVSLVGSSIENAFEIADKIRKCVVDKIKLPKKKGVKVVPKITLSIGVASSENSKSPKLLIERADKAMYEAKNYCGGNKVIKYLS